MKKMCCVLTLIILFCMFLYSIPAQEQFLIYGIYYGTADNKELWNIRWSSFDIMILHPGTPENTYRNLNDSAFLMLMQTMRDAGVEVFLYLDIGCERDAGGMHYSKTDPRTWIAFKKDEIDLFVRYADGIFFDCVGPKHRRHEYGPQFGKDVQELVDYVHYSQREVIISDLFMLMEWIEENQPDAVPYEADYVLFEGAWSKTPDQYSDEWSPLAAVTFANSNDFKILGMDYGRVDDEDRIMYCYCASRVMGFTGFYYAENFYDITMLDEYDLGLPLSNYTIEDALHKREFQKGTVYVNFQAHKGWIEGEAVEEEAGISIILVVVGFVLTLYMRTRYIYSS
ncbi:MAG: hypothetical protein HXS44_15230 [Theionarchaea archaeon]|nr:hypothetical protein [Theionarchaea archaeon]